LTAFPRMTAKTRDRVALVWLEWAVTDSNRRHPACKSVATQFHGRSFHT
jgi:hypothetical protein